MDNDLIIRADIVGLFPTKGWMWQAQIRIKGKKKHLGLFNTRKQAAVAYDHAVHKHRLQTSSLNFPTMKHDLNKEPKGRKKYKVGITGYRGVDKRGERYRAMISVDGKKTSLGTHNTAKKAARAYDQAILKYNQPKNKLNFPQQTKQYYCGIEIKDEPSDQIYHQPTQNGYIKYY
jgi:hypothetical protein